MRFIVENSPSLKFCCYTAASQTSNSNISGLRNQILNYFMLWCRGPGGLIDEKNKRSKSRATVPLKYPQVFLRLVPLMSSVLYMSVFSFANTLGAFLGILLAQGTRK
jgi:hypothetical protein